MDQSGGGGTWKWVFEYFEIQKWMLHAVRGGKVDEKNVVICLVSMIPSWVMVLKLSKNVHVCQFCADFSKKYKSIKAIYIHLKGLVKHFEEMILFIMLWLTISETSKVKEFF